MGGGDAMKDENSDGAKRRKRSTDNKQVTTDHAHVMEDSASNGVVREKRSFHPKFRLDDSLTGTFIRSKRQTGGQQMPSGMSGGNTESIFDSIKQTFNRVIEVAKQMFAQARSAMGNGQKDAQKPSIPSNMETMQ